MPVRDPRLGQVFTPAAVADLVLSLALPPGRDRRSVRVLDPACGDGVFLARAQASGIAACHIAGYEVDPVMAQAARRAVPGVQVERTDFLEVPVPTELFDAVVGNPPYVRQELLGSAAKDRIRRRLAVDWPGALLEAAGRADLAVAFVARALRFVKPGGRLAFVLSAAALEAGYGDALRAFIADRATVVAVLASPRERWFAEAAVHGVILVLERLPSRAPPACARFARLRVPVADASLHVRSIEDLDAVAEVRTVAASHAAEAAWGPLLRAPAIWFEVAALAGTTALRPLGELAMVRRGVTSGANAFFYMNRAEARSTGIEEAFLRPVFKTPRQVLAPRVRAASLDTLAFVCGLDAEQLAAHPGAWSHVRSHAAALAQRPTLAARPLWWALRARPGRVFLTKAYDVRFVQYLSDEPVLCDQRMYTVFPRGEDEELLAAALNGTFTALALESLGRASMGDGVLEWPVSDVCSLPVLDPGTMDAAAVRQAFRRLAGRAVRPVWDEERARDRRSLDLALAAGVPRLREILPAAAAALTAAVGERITRSGRAVPRRERRSLPIGASAEDRPRTWPR